MTPRPKMPSSKDQLSGARNKILAIMFNAPIFFDLPAPPIAFSRSHERKDIKRDPSVSFDFHSSNPSSSFLPQPLPHPGPRSSIYLNKLFDLLHVSSPSPFCPRHSLCAIQNG